MQLSVCAEDYTPWLLTYKVVTCIRGKVEIATGYIMTGLSEYMLSTVGVIFVLATVLFGIRIIGGEHHLKARAVGFFIRLGIVATFSYNLGGIASYMFAIFDQIIMMVSGGSNVWIRLDIMLGKIFGFNQGHTLAHGVIGLIGGALFASSLGMTFAFAALMSVLNLVFLILDIVYAYLSAVIVFAFLLILSPLIVPLALFYYTERFIKKWLDMIVATILMPALLFAFLWMTLLIFSTLIGNIFGLLGAPCTANWKLNDPVPFLEDCPIPDLSAFWRSNDPMFSWLVPSDPNLVNQLNTIAEETPGLTTTKNIPAVQTMINPFLNRSLDTNTISRPTISFGRNGVYIMQQLIYAFIALWLFAMLTKSMLRRIPDVARSIAAIAVSIPFGGGSAADRIKMMESNMKIGAGLAAGGALGGEAGAAIGKATRSNGKMARELGGIIGGLAGALGGKRL